MQNFEYAFLIISATLLYGISVNTVGHHLTHMKAPWITAVSITLVSIPCAIILATTDIDVIIEHPSGWRSFGAVATLAVVGTGIANILFFRLTQTAGPILASTVTYLIPIVAVSWGSMLGEEISTGQMGFAGIVLLGVYLSNRPPKIRNKA